MTKNKTLLKTIAQKYSLELLLLFGSRVSGEHYKESDFDIAYLSGKDLTLEEESRFIVDLAPLFKSENIDLTNLKKSPPLLFYAVFQNCHIIYEKSPLMFYQLRAYSFKKYVETKPFYEEKFKRLEKEIVSL